MGNYDIYGRCDIYGAYTTHDFFPKKTEKDVFFPQHFRDPPIFSRKRKYFPLKFGDLPTIQQLFCALIDVESDGLANIDVLISEGRN